MDSIARLSVAERQELFRQSTAKFPYLSEAAIEKDFWICWILKQLFSSRLKDLVIFKGGTSLAKIFRLIYRFSEDIDLILNWKDNPVGDPLAQRGYSSQAKFNEKLDSWGVEFIARNILPEVQKFCAGICHAEIQDGKADNIVITYPKAFSDPYLRPQLLLEIGAKAAWVPHATYRITAYVAEAYPQLFSDPGVSIVATTPERSFWEKVTILHAESHRPENSRVRKRYSRHYYDTVMLARSSVKQSAFLALELLDHVVEFKDKFYHSGWANYKDAKPGSMKLLPPRHSIKDLRDDYEKMRTMIYGEYLSFDEILSALRALEKEINSL